MEPGTTYYDTIIYQGTIGLYNTGSNPEKNIRIQFLSYKEITPTIGSNGILDSIIDVHYEEHGAFNSTLDTINFISYLHGLGGGVKYTVSGVRIP